MRARPEAGPVDNRGRRTLEAAIAGGGPDGPTILETYPKAAGWIQAAKDLIIW